MPGMVGARRNVCNQVWRAAFKMSVHYRTRHTLSGVRLSGTDAVPRCPYFALQVPLPACGAIRLPKDLRRVFYRLPLLPRLTHDSHTPFAGANLVGDIK